MEKLKDEDIQRFLDNNISIEPSDEVLLYKKVFKALSQVPNSPVDGLADDVIQAIHHQNERKATIKTYLAVAVSIILGFAIFITGVSSIDRVTARDILQEFNHFKWIIFFVICILSAVSIIERKLPA